MNLRTQVLSWVAVAALTASVASAGEKRLKKSEVPVAVRDAVSAKYPKAKMIGFAQENDEGKTVYEVELKAGPGGRTDVTVSPEGRVLIEEQTITMKHLPEPVRKAFASSRYGKAKVSRVEKVTETAKPDAPTYELLVQHAGKRHELVFSQSGELTKDEPKTERDND